MGFENIRPSREACPQSYAANPNELGRTYLPKAGGERFLANAYSPELEERYTAWERVAMAPEPREVRDAVLPSAVEVAAKPEGVVWRGITVTDVFTASAALLFMTFTYVIRQSRKLKRENPRGYRYHRIREERNETPLFSQAFLNLFSISAARSAFDWASRLFQRPNSAHPFDGLRRRSSQ